MSEIYKLERHMPEIHVGELYQWERHKAEMYELEKHMLQIHKLWASCAKAQIHMDDTHEMVEHVICRKW